MKLANQHGTCLLPVTMAVSLAANILQAGDVPMADKWMIESPGSFEQLMAAQSGKQPDDVVAPAANGVSFPDAGTGSLWHWRGVITIPETGDYRFFISADDAGKLWLSENETLHRRKLVAWQDDWSNPNQWGKFPTQKSEPVHLEKGSRHAIEMVWSNRDNQGHGELGWQPPGAAGPAPVPMKSTDGGPLVTAYQVPPDDDDDDALPDSWEKERGLKVDRSDGGNSGFGDADDDGITNQEEYLAGTDPRKGDTRPGFARISTWYGLQHYEMSTNYPDDLPWLPFKNPAVDSVQPQGKWSQGGGNTAQRLRWWLTAPRDGYYSLAIDAVGFQQMLLSDDSHAAGARPVLTAGGVFAGYSRNFSDPRLATESPWIHFKKGEPRYLEVRQIRHMGGNSFDLAWTGEDGTRQAIPAACLSSYVPRGGSADAEPSLNREAGEIQATGAKIDFDIPSGKPLSGGWVHFDSHSSGHNSLVAEPKPDLKRTGICNNFGGGIEYPFTTAAAGYALLAMEAQLCNESSMVVHLNCEREIDGVKFGRETLRAGGGAAPFFRCVTPWLAAGKHMLRLRFEPGIRGASIRLLSMNLQMIGDAAGTAKVREVLRAGNAFLPMLGDNGFLISPACVEVASRTGERPVLAADGRSITPAPATPGTWWADVPLPENGGKLELTATFKADATKADATAWWGETSIFEHPEIIVRVGDALRVTALPPDATGSAVVIRKGVESATPAGQPVVCRFDQAGEETIEGRHTASDGKVRNGTMKVRVLARLSKPLGEITARTDRCGVLEGLPPGAWPDGGVGVGFRANPANTGGTGKPWSVFPRRAGDSPTVVRAGPVGPVMGSMMVHGIEMGTWQWSTNFLKEFKDGNQFAIATCLMTGLPPDWTVRYTLRDTPSRSFVFYRQDQVNPKNPLQMELRPWREGAVAVGEFWLKQTVKDKWDSDDGVFEVFPPEGTPGHDVPH